MGRFADPGLWILGALGQAPLGFSALFDAVVSIHGPIGPGTLLGALARLEQCRLVERVSESDGAMYRLASHSTASGR